MDALRVTASEASLRAARAAISLARDFEASGLARRHGAGRSTDRFITWFMSLPFAPNRPMRTAGYGTVWSMRMFNVPRSLPNS
jgi:hypothetical protein